MQNTISDVRLQTTESTKSTGISRKWDSEQAQMTDPFMQIIMNLISQYADGTEGAEGTEGMQGLQGVLGNLDSQTGESANAQLLGLLGTLPTLQFSQTEQTSELSSLLGAKTAGLESTVLDQMSTTSYWQLFEKVLETSQETGKTPDAGVILQLLGSDAAKLSDTTQLSDATAQLPQNLMQLLTSKDGEANQSTNIQQLLSQLKELAQEGSISVTKEETGAEAEDGSLQNPKDFFGTAIEKAKELISKQSQKTETDTDAGEAIAEPQSKAVTPFELRFKSTEPVAETPVSEQISTGIKENLSLGKNEFTVKLNPESLGEITVKLVEEEGKTTLTITTASAQTAKLINSDMDALKAAVAPMNVHVNEAVTHSEASQQGGMQQFDMSGQFAGQQQFASQQFSSGQSFLQMTQGYRETENEAYAPELTAAAAMSAVSTGRLDAYI